MEFIGQWNQVIHTSATSTVTLCRVDGEALAVKAYAKARLRPRHLLNLRREVAALAHLRHCGTPGVVQLLHADESPDAVLLFFRAAAGGDLHSALRLGRWDEAALRGRVVVPLLRALRDLHALGYVHRDVKPENVFIDEAGAPVLGDFGLAIDQRRERPVSRVGTLEYMAPEVLAQPSAEEAARLPPALLRCYDEKVDCWGVGVLVFEALSGRAPFAHADPRIAALKARFAAPPELPAGTSPACADFVARALAQDPRRRPSAAELLAHPWLAGPGGAAPGAAAPAAAAACGADGGAAAGAAPAAQTGAAKSVPASPFAGALLLAPPHGLPWPSPPQLSLLLHQRRQQQSQPQQQQQQQQQPQHHYHHHSFLGCSPTPHDAQRAAALAAVASALPASLAAPPRTLRRQSAAAQWGAAQPASPLPLGRVPSMGVGLSLSPQLQHARHPRRCTTASLAGLASGAAGEPAPAPAPALAPAASLPPPHRPTPLSRQRSLPAATAQDDAARCAATPEAGARRAGAAAAARSPCTPPPAAFVLAAASGSALCAPSPGSARYMAAWAGVARSSQRLPPPSPLPSPVPPCGFPALGAQPSPPPPAQQQQERPAADRAAREPLAVAAAAAATPPAFTPPPPPPPACAKASADPACAREPPRPRGLCVEVPPPQQGPSPAPSWEAGAAWPPVPASGADTDDGSCPTADGERGGLSRSSSSITTSSLANTRCSGSARGSSSASGAEGDAEAAPCKAGAGQPPRGGGRGADALALPSTRLQAWVSAVLLRRRRGLPPAPKPPAAWAAREAQLPAREG
ncbi:aurora protein [Raphidocelis subcapitata]|uniref:Aurora protein n=1 Tax=Raphidocelis subcapitata TaxID=307507 RepID=A0A2V0P410_9CHLO|nr:aurora protein [Raphidocelis subcapitata]|eukprot:GBF92590.1 aurora protein [Raphidocelis subcapitata]